MILNFYDIKKVLKPIVDRLDHKILIPKNSKLLEITESDEQIIIKIPNYDKEYEFPKSDVIMLPIVNTTVEEISHYLADKLMWNKEIKKENIDQVTVTVFEYEGQGVTFELFPRYEQQ
jgi:6-pyruvoyltetrahydropterin/6-carboxytetrahydropterin synthase